MKTWLNHHKTHLLIAAILLLAAFLRLYRIEDFMTFLGDEGRDALIVRDIIQGQLVGIGPNASVGGFYMGPFYYYMIAPVMWLFKFNPVGPSILIALLSVATVFLIYFFGKKMFNEPTGIIAALFYAVSPVVINYSHSSWNPNPIPFFVLLLFLFLVKAVKQQSLVLFAICGFLYGILFQLHYLTTFLGVAIFVFLLWKDNKIKPFLGHCLGMLAGFFLCLSPLVAFELRHNFLNTLGIIHFVTGGTGETGFSLSQFLTTVAGAIFRLFSRILMNFPDMRIINDWIRDANLIIYLWTAFVISLIFVSLDTFWRQYGKTKKGSTKNLQYSFLLLWFGVGVLLFGLYKKPIYDYYFEFMFPLPFLLSANAIISIWQRAKVKWLAIPVFLAILIPSVHGMPTWYEPNKQFDQTRRISQFVIDKAEGKPFNFAIISGANSDFAYIYFFTIWNKEPVTIVHPDNDPKRTSVTDQLFVVCESLPCDPLKDSLWKIAFFGKATIANEWDVPPVKIYKLVHTSTVNQ